MKSVSSKCGCIKELCHPLFAIMVYIVTEFARKCTLSELMYADDLILMSETIEELKNKNIKWKEQV